MVHFSSAALRLQAVPTPGKGQGASEPFQKLVIRHRAWLLVETQRRYGDAGAEDHVAEAFARLFECFREELPPEPACVTWLRQTIRNLAQTHRRSEKTRRRNEVLLQMMGGLSDLRGCIVFDSKDVLRCPPRLARMTAAHINWAMDELSPIQARAMNLWIKGLSSDKIGQQLGIKPGAARKRIHDARKKLASYLQKLFGMDGEWESVD